MHSGSLCNASLPLETKNQVILPKEDHVTKLIVYDYQSICDHSSNEHILALIREDFWILQRSSTVRSVFSKCVSCCCRQAPLTTEITPVCRDPSDREPLTPNHLFLLKSEVTLPPGLFKEKNSYRQWKQVQKIMQIFSGEDWAGNTFPFCNLD